jgi:hypothetical protein
MVKKNTQLSAKKTPTNVVGNITKTLGVDSVTKVYHREPVVSAAHQTQWQFGDWSSLQNLPISEIEKSEAKMQLVLIVAVAHLQEGGQTQAQRYIKQARQWGASRELCARILISGAYNSLGRISLINQDSLSATKHFSESVSLGTPGIDSRLVMPIRMVHQAMQLDMDPEQIKDWQLLLTKSQSKNKTLNHDRDLPISLSQQLMERLDQLLNQLVNEGQGMILDGVAVFDQKDPFLPGKLAMALAYWATEYSPSDACTQERCQAFQHITAWTKGIKVQSWGIDFYLRALWSLQQAGLLHKCLNMETLASLKKQLDWRSFVNKESYSLKNKPSNFYGVAYSIAYHRYQLGWEGPEHADALLDKIIEHYQSTAGEFGFADETNGKGRFDRYSFLLIAEIAHRFREADLPLPERMQGWLKNSANYVLINLNKEGDGFQYGRSIGAYGDTAFLEILSAAAWFGVLGKQEQKMAYHFSFLCTQKFLNYWWDNTRSSVNLWDEGRTTDKYRGKFRILGENFSLIHQHLYTHRIWKELGFSPDHMSDQAYSDWLDNLPRATLTWFNQVTGNEGQQALFTWRDGDCIFNLPLVNGETYYEHSAYLPTPYSSAGIQAVPDSLTPILIPRVKLKTGEELLPVCSFRDIKMTQEEDGALLSWEQEALILSGCETPTEYKGLSISTTFEFKRGSIKRRDRLSGCQLRAVENVSLEWPNAPLVEKINHADRIVIFESPCFEKMSFLGYERINNGLKVIYKPIEKDLFNDLELVWLLAIKI